MKKVSLSQSLDPVSLDYVSNAFKFQPTESGIVGFDAYGTISSVFFYNNGTAACSQTVNAEDVIHFESHQDCVDFLRIK